MSASGRFIAVAGQIGGVPPRMQLVRGMQAQFIQSLDNVLSVVKEGGGKATDIISMTVYVTELRQYHAVSKSLGPMWTQRMGKHYPAMALVEVKGLMEAHALVEIQALAVVSD